MLTRFAHTIWRASTDTRAYLDDFVTRRTGSALGYLYALTTTLALFMLLPFAISVAVFAPTADTFIRNQLAVLQTWYPDELVLTLTGGVLSTNVDEPYALDLPAEWRTSRDELETTHMVVIDTEGSIEDFQSYDTAVLLTETAMVMKDNNGIRVHPFADMGVNMTIDEAYVAGHVAKVNGFVPAAPWITGGIALLILIALPWLVGGVVWAFNLLFLLWSTLLVWMVASVLGRALHYGTLYRLGAFGLTSSLLLHFALSMVGLGWWWLPSLLFFVWMTCVIAVFPKRAPTAPPAPPAAATPVKKATSRSPRKPRTKAL